MTYRPDIDGLRAVAVLAVIVFHAFPSALTGGYVGVDVFFVISGFLISRIILTDLEKSTFRFTDFYGRRVRRIFPALLVVLIACLVGGWFVLMADEYMQLGKHTAAGAGFAMNLLLQGESGYFDNASETKPLLHLWSLGIEEQFYIAWPLLLWSAWRWRVSPFNSTLLLAVASLAWYVLQGRTDSVQAFYAPHTRIWELLAGALLAHASLRGFKVERALVRNTLSTAGALLIALSLSVNSKESGLPAPMVLLPVLGAVLLIAAGGDAWLNRRVLAHRHMVGIGLISFPLYLWHWPLLSFARIVEGETPDVDIRVWAVLAAFLLAGLTYQLVENPLRHGSQLRSKTVSLALAMLGVGFVGFWVHESGGLTDRPIVKVTAAITTAKADWRYEPTTFVDGVIGKLHELPGAGPESVLFVGDSLMGQYFPRVQALYAAPAKPQFSTVFASRNHCRPVPNFNFVSGPENINCQDYYRAAMQLAKEKRFVRVVLGGNWHSLLAGDVLTAQGNEWVQDIKALRAAGKEVVILGRPPQHYTFAPNLVAKGIRRNLAMRIDDQSIERNVIDDQSVLRTLRLVAQKSGATLVEPLDVLCSGGRCPFVLDGRPLFNDHAHLRASYAAEAATFIDPILSAN
jgi:peptidoglycan/LPS O-acetylase OafA/YrhL